MRLGLLTPGLLLSIERGVRSVLTVATTWVLADHLGAIAFGELQLALVLITIAVAASAFGLEHLTISELAARKDDGSGIGAFLLARSLTSIAAAVLVVTFASTAPLWPQSSDILLGASAALLFSGFDAVEYSLKARGVFATPVLVRLAAALLGAGAKLSYVHSGLQSPFALGLALSVEGCASGAAFAAIYWHSSSRRHMRLTRHATREALDCLKRAAPLAASQLLTVGYSRIDQLLLAALAGKGAIAQYGLAMRIAETVLVVPLAFVAARLPQQALQVRGGDMAFWETSRQLVVIVAAIAALLATTLQVMAPTLATVLAVPGYGHLPAILSILVLSAPLIVANSVRTNWMIASQRSDLVPRVTVAAAAASTALTLALVPPLGAFGAAIAAVGTQLVSATVFPMFNSPLRLFLMGLSGHAGRVRTRG